MLPQERENLVWSWREVQAWHQEIWPKIFKTKKIRNVVFSFVSIDVLNVLTAILLVNCNQHLKETNE